MGKKERVKCVKMGKKVREKVGKEWNRYLRATKKKKNNARKKQKIEKSRKNLKK